MIHPHAPFCIQNELLDTQEQLTKAAADRDAAQSERDTLKLKLTDAQELAKMTAIRLDRELGALERAKVTHTPCVSVFAVCTKLFWPFHTYETFCCTSWCVREKNNKLL